MQFRWNSIGTVFRDEPITTFPELELFASVTTLANQPFSGTTLESFLPPCNLQKIQFDAISYPTSINMAVLNLPTTLTSFEAPNLRGHIGRIIINSNITTFMPAYCYGSSIKGSKVYTFVLNVTSVIPITTTGGNGQYSKNHYYYVPDELLTQYREASGWSGFPTHILPISELPTS